MATIIIKNSGGSAVDIDDLGISIPATSQRTLLQTSGGEFTLDELDASSDLYTLVNAGTLVVNNGSSDLSTANGLLHLRIDTDWEIDDSYYTKTELQTSGSSNVHWDNITNAPAIGSVDWLDAGICRIEQLSSSPPASPSTNDFYIDTDDDHLYKYDGSSWNDQGAPATNDIVINKADNNIYKWNGSSWVSSSPSENNAMIVSDDGDSKQAQYVYNGTTWVKMADIDWGDHGSLSGLGDDDHTQYHNDTRGDARYYRQNQHINSSAGAADSGKPVVLDVTGHIDSSMIDDSDIDHGSIGGLADDDHTQYHNDTRGDARYYRQNQFINSSSGATDAAKPILTDATGKIDISFLPADADTNVMVADFGRGRSNQNSQWLRNSTGSVSNKTGPRAPKAITIVGMSVQTANNANATFYIRKNGASTNLGNVALSGVSGNHSYSLSINLSAGEFIGVYMDVSSGNVDHPIVQVYYTWQ